MCLIYPTCKVGVTILSTYLPHRGVVGIRAVALVWRFKPPGSGATRANFILHWASYTLGSAGKVTTIAGQQAQPFAKAVQTKHTQSQLGPSRSSLWLGWKNFGSSFANYHQLQCGPQLWAFMEQRFFHCRVHWHVALLPPKC